MRASVWLTTFVGVGLLVLARPARRLPAAQPTTEDDGLGPVTERVYWQDVSGLAQSPSALVSEVLGHFPALMPRPLAFTRKVSGQPGMGRPGDRFFLLLFGMRRAWVEVESVSAGAFRNRTLRHNPDAGWVSFSAEERDDGVVRLKVHSRVRSSTWLDRLTYLAGVRYLQRLTWETLLRRAARLGGGHALAWGHQTAEYSAGRREGAAAPADQVTSGA
ncbi:DUF1990 family protein [Deinococcus radiomollis]|uniref:hypothetical protein n=1 Tax=Deinococcus radiomollis TaxID=468916 RepID=UPI00389263CB